MSDLTDCPLKEAEKKYCNFGRYALYVINFLSIFRSITLFSLPVLAKDNAELFVSKCGSFHKEDGVARVANPADKAANVWIRYFKRLSRRHPVDLHKIQVYLIKYAADSKTPYAAIIPQ
jgi:hypothetical protein